MFWRIALLQLEFRRDFNVTDTGLFHSGTELHYIHPIKVENAFCYTKQQNIGPDLLFNGFRSIKDTTVCFIVELFEQKLGI